MKSDNNEKDRQFKVCICGKEHVGKTALMNRYVTGYFAVDYSPTIAASFISAHEVIGDQEITLNMWDTAGQEKYQSMMPLYLRNVDCVLLVLDTTEKSSWDFIEKWYDMEFQNIIPPPILTLCANKSDLDPTYDFTPVKEWADKKNIPILRTSAAEGTNVSEVFKNAAMRLYKRDLENRKRVNPVAQVKFEDPKKEENSICC